MNLYMYSLQCIKCRAKYDSTDPDPYLCEPCNDKRKAIAAEVDAKLGPRDTTPPVTPLMAYDEARKTQGRFVNARSLI